MLDEKIIKEMVELKNQGKTIRQIKEELGLHISRVYIAQLIKNAQAKEKEVVDSEQIAA
jgi:orotate phosphoribosyltransferase-like protein